MEEYLCLTVIANENESEPAFTARLAAFWTHMVRTRPDDYEKVYAEATRFGQQNGRLTRQYMLETAVLETLVEELKSQGFTCNDVDTDDTYSKYEATPPDWFWLEH